MSPPGSSGAELRVVVADDEPLARERMLRLLEADEDVEVVGVCESGEQTVEAIQSTSPDLVLLDVQMSDLDGFGVLSRLDPAKMPLVIFVTAFDEYALSAFRVHALDYLVKPLDPEQFAEAMQRAKQHARQSSAAGEPQRIAELLEHVRAAQRELGRLVSRSAGRFLDRLLVRVDGRLMFVKVDDIDWIEAAGNYVRLHLGKQSHLLRESMSRLEGALDPGNFQRIHRATIVNVDRIREMQPWFSGEYLVLLHDGTRLKLSRFYRDRFVEQFNRPA
ncbi:MAG: LytR/AlgR family response regulator transcription factor [Gemmatimonadaceae bacterium]